MFESSDAVNFQTRWALAFCLSAPTKSTCEAPAIGKAKKRFTLISTSDGTELERACPPLSEPHSHASTEERAINDISSFCAERLKRYEACSIQAPPTRSAKTAHSASESCAASLSWFSMLVSVCMDKKDYTRNNQRSSQPIISSIFGLSAKPIFDCFPFDILKQRN